MDDPLTFAIESLKHPIMKTSIIRTYNITEKHISRFFAYFELQY